MPDFCGNLAPEGELFTVALLGADGAGKTTIGRRLQEELPDLIRYIYMGINLDSSNLVLPTTRLLLRIRYVLGKPPAMGGPPDPQRAKPRSRNPIKQIAAVMKSSLRLMNQLGEEWYRQVIAKYYRRRGYVVLFDRHFFYDYYAHDVVSGGRSRRLSNRIHGFLLKHFYPEPDLVIFLDAPAEVLFARKREGTVELLERRRQEYLQIRERVRHFFTVDVTRPVEDVARDVTALIKDFQQARSGREREVQSGQH